MKRKKPRHWKHPHRNRHHILPKNRGGKDEIENLLLLKTNRHHAFHYLFGDKTLEEAIVLLIRIHRAKRRCTKRLTGICVLERLLCKSKAKRQRAYGSGVHYATRVAQATSKTMS